MRGKTHPPRSVACGMLKCASDSTVDAVVSCDLRHLSFSGVKEAQCTWFPTVTPLWYYQVLQLVEPPEGRITGAEAQYTGGYAGSSVDG